MFPKKIWRYWAQGWENAPFMVQHCTESIYHYAPDWEIINLDDDNIGEYIELPEILLKEPNFPKATLSDLIRILLLKKYGGVWIDATIFLNTNLTEFLAPLDGDFFCFWRWPHKAAMSSWFLASKKEGYIASTCADEFLKVLTKDFIERNRELFSKWRGSPDYFIFHKTFESIAKVDKKYNSIIQNMQFKDSINVLMDTLNGYNKDCCHESESYLSFTPMYKLSYSVNDKNYNKNSIVEKMINKMKSIYNPPLKHLHTSLGLRTFHMYNSFLNIPEKVKDIAGPLESEGDLKLCADKASRYHVYNFSSHDGKNGAQILAPYGSSRLFYRYQVGDAFSSARELAYRDEIEALRKELEVLRYENFWEKIFDKIIDTIPPGITPAYKFDRFYTQFFIDGVDRKIHYELQYKSNVLYLCIHCEDANLGKIHRNKFICLSKILEEDIIENNGNIFINKRVDRVFIRQMFSKFLEITYNHVILMK